MTYAETIEYLYQIRLFGQKLGLENIRRLLELLGNPQRDLKFIHIAGTNGKGSVAAMLHAIYAHAGRKTALYTSPHLVSFCERFQINGVPIPESDVVRLVETMQPPLRAMVADKNFRHPTFFEVVTAMALLYFREQNTEIVIWETGLGGKFDATNVVTPLVSVITNVDYDHTEHLGATLREIAEQKCGIIKPFMPVVTAALGEPLEIVREFCKNLDCPLTEITENDAVEAPLLGKHQRINAAVALATVAAITDPTLKLDAKTAREGLKFTRWPGRFQIVEQNPTVVLDGAHNAAGAATLAATIREIFGENRRIFFVLGILRDKNYREFLQKIAPLARRIYTARVNSERSLDAETLAAAAKEAASRAEICAFSELRDAFFAAKSAANDPEDVIVIAGSLFLVGEALAKLGFSVDFHASTERELVLQ